MCLPLTNNVMISVYHRLAPAVSKVTNTNCMLPAYTNKLIKKAHQHQSKGKSQEKISQHDWYGLYDCVTQFFYFTFHFDFKSLSLISLFPTNYFSISFLCRQWSDIGSLVPGKTMRNTLREFLKLSRQSPRSRASTDFGSLLA